VKIQPVLRCGCDNRLSDSDGAEKRATSFLFDQRPRQVEFEMQLGSLQETGRTAGVLPIRVDVPRAGTSHQFVKPLVVDQETVVKLRYKRRS
jgi:hypothetical protein